MGRKGEDVRERDMNGEKWTGKVWREMKAAQDAHCHVTTWLADLLYARSVPYPADCPHQNAAEVGSVTGFPKPSLLLTTFSPSILALPNRARQSSPGPPPSPAPPNRARSHSTHPRAPPHLRLRAGLPLVAD